LTKYTNSILYRYKLNLTFAAVKNLVKTFLQAVLGYRRYLRWFAWYKVKNLNSDSREDDFRFFLSLLPEDGLVLDIGANLGFLSIWMARQVKRGQVIAFEPMPDNLDALNYVIEKSGQTNIRVEACALGDHDGTAEMVLPVLGKAKQQGLSHVVHDSILEHNEGIKFSVPLRMLDSCLYLFEPNKKVSGIKMDVENFEQFVLLGAKRLLHEQHPLIYIELWENDNRKKCFELVREAGYEVMVHEGGKLVAFEAAKHTKINFFLKANA
jgi:FkbM family methyltransferase